MHFTELSFPARHDALPSLTAQIAHLAASLGIGPDMAQRLQLVVEELFINTVTHGHGGDSENPVHLGIRIDGGHLTLVYRDTAPPFNPGQTVPRYPTGEDVGGFGVALIHGLSKAVRYQRTGEENRLEIDF